VLRAFRPARAELAPPGKVTIYTRPDHWLYPLERHRRACFDIPYAGEASTPEQILHIIFPEAGEGPFPLMIFVHGGGWSLFNSNHHEVVYTGEMPLYALERGYALAYIDYRLTNTRIMPGQLYDVKAAVHYLRANAEKYALIPDQIVLSGDSAGAHLADLAALTADEDAFEDPDRLYPEVSCAVQAVWIISSVLSFRLWDWSTM
jgi:acetyl esterase/lipase